VVKLEEFLNAFFQAIAKLVWEKAEKQGIDITKLTEYELSKFVYETAIEVTRKISS
jgi:transcriptional regulator